jgi:hypothetical protein
VQQRLVHHPFNLPKIDDVQFFIELELWEIADDRRTKACASLVRMSTGYTPDPISYTDLTLRTGLTRIIKGKGVAK